MSWSILKSISDQSGYLKRFIIALPDSCFIESVIIKHKNEIHICLPTQVGCPIRCKHCATTYSQTPFIRNLSESELFSLAEYHLIITKTLDNDLPIILSFSGHGEPLLNWDAVQVCFNKYKKRVNRIYVTTIGINKILRNILQDTDYSIDFYISLHGSSDSERIQLIPVPSKLSNIDNIFSFVSDYLLHGGRVVLNYVLTNFNTTITSAHKLVEYLQRLPMPVEVRFTDLVDIGIATEVHPPAAKQLLEFFNLMYTFYSPAWFRKSVITGSMYGVACGQLRGGFLKDL